MNRNWNFILNYSTTTKVVFLKRTNENMWSHPRNLDTIHLKFVFCAHFKNILFILENEINCISVDFNRTSAIWNNVFKKFYVNNLFNWKPICISVQTNILFNAILCLYSYKKKKVLFVFKLLYFYSCTFIPIVNKVNTLKTNFNLKM